MLDSSISIRTVIQSQDIMGQTGTGHPAGSLSQGKGRNKDPGTTSSVPGTKSLSHKKNINLKKKILIFSTFFLISHILVWDRTGQTVTILSRSVSRQYLKIPSRLVLWQDFGLVLLSLFPGTLKELLSLCHVLFETVRSCWKPY